MKPCVAAQAEPTESGQDGAAATHATKATAEPCQALPVTSGAREGSPQGFKTHASQRGSTPSLQEGNLPSAQGG